MILEEYTYIKLNGRNIPYFKDKGYLGVKDDIIKVKIQDLNHGSSVKILVKCLICGLEKRTIYYNYRKCVDKHGYYTCSRKCSQNKIEKTCMDKYGCPNPFQNEDIKNKIKNTLFDKYGVFHPMLSEEIKNKLKETNLERWGCEWVFENEEVQEKIFKTMIHKYGCKYALQNKESCEKFIKNCDFDKLFKNAIKIKNYKNTKLYYQGSYELDFLKLCEKLGILKEIKNGNIYNYIEEDKNYGYRTLTDFSYKNFEIEIKSNWILEKQGGIEKLNAKRRAVEKQDKNYILIIEKTYDEFLNKIKK